MKREHVIMLTDAALSGDRNVIRKEAEKILKYTDHTTETEGMGNVRTKVLSFYTLCAKTAS
jgi:uncharacterized protein YlxP (DUF503 family)